MLFQSISCFNHKLLAEAKLEETKTLLGWILNTRLLLVILPNNKFVSWSKDIELILTTGKSNHDDLDTLIGRLGHTSTIIPHMKHFMNRLRMEKNRAAKNTRKKIKLREAALKDLSLHLHYNLNFRNSANSSPLLPSVSSLCMLSIT